MKKMRIAGRYCSGLTPAPPAPANAANLARRRTRIGPPSTRRSVRQNLLQKLLGALIARVIEEFVRRRLFDNLAGVHEYHPVGHGLGETHFMGDAKHG